MPDLNCIHVAPRALACLMLLVAGLACESGGSGLPPRPAVVFPNDHWIQPASTATGFRLHQASAPLRNFLGTPADWSEELARLSGFSPLQPVLIETKSGCPALPAPGQEVWSVADTSPVLLTSGDRRIPWFGEPAEDPRDCIIFPVDAFVPESMATVTITASFGAELADNAAPLTVTFPIGSFAERVDSAFRIVAAARLWAERQGTLLSEVVVDPDDGRDVQHARMTWRGRFRVPDYTGPDGRVTFDEHGAPVQYGETTEVFYAVLSTASTAITGPLPLVQYGHGLFGMAREVWYDSQTRLRDSVGGLFAGIPWGMAVRYFHRAAFALLDPDRLPILRDQVWQSMANQVIFTRVLRDELAPIVAASTGQPVSDMIDYIGISQGGILGSVLAALDPDLRRIVLHVGGGGWTPMMTHSSNWFRREGIGYGDIVRELWPDPEQRSFAYALWQNLWDQWDAAIYAPYWFTPPSASFAAPPAERRVLYTWAIADPQVPNFSSETVMRIADGVLLQPSVTQPFGVRTAPYADGPFPVMGMEWDVGPGEPAHSEPRKLPAFANQVARFLRDGIVIDTCGGKPCVFDLP